MISMDLIKKSPNRWVWITVAIIVLLFLLIRISGLGGDSEGLQIGDKVGLVEITGEIFISKHHIKKLEKLRKRKDIRAVVIRVDSPGGLVAPTQEIYAKVVAVDREKPVIVSVGSAAASGGYYIAAGGRKVVANPGSIVGSIGVRFDFPVAVELMDKIGLRFETFKSGELKDAGSPTREVTERDREFFRSVIKNIKEQFVNDIALSREMSIPEVESLADGRVFTGDQALELGLIDTLGTLEDAIAIAAESGGIKGKPRVFEFKKKRPSIFETIWGDLENKLGTQVRSAPAYLWVWE